MPSMKWLSQLVFDLGNVLTGVSSSFTGGKKNIHTKSGTTWNTLQKSLEWASFSSRIHLSFAMEEGFFLIANPI